MVDAAHDLIDNTAPLAQAKLIAEFHGAAEPTAAIISRRRADGLPDPVHEGADT
ncbi:hypothetical protein ABT124_48135 [Streptomyces sp. NPDC001982]|uniref:hypothetical protein n=1 Tax=Streptomyces sp. NPDC001982 TaxID=3154405 RepID=UPI003330BD42